jgi:proteic killer suppression protein
VIKSFASAEEERIFNGYRSKQFPVAIQKTAYRKLRIIHNAKDIRDLKALPGNKFEMLERERKGQCSIRINDQYRVCFRWAEVENNAYDVEITDYH